MSNDEVEFNDDLIYPTEKEDNKQESCVTISNLEEINPENKLDLLKQLGMLEQQGIKLHKHYTIDSDYNEMKFELQSHKYILDEDSKKQFNIGIDQLSNDVIKLSFKKALENMKLTYDPAYDKLFDELIEKYKEKASYQDLQPETKLITSIIIAGLIQFMTKK